MSSHRLRRLNRPCEPLEGSDLTTSAQDRWVVVRLVDVVQLATALLATFGETLLRFSEEIG
jgi:hypothetical protein